MMDFLMIDDFGLAVRPLKGHQRRALSPTCGRADRKRFEAKLNLTQSLDQFNWYFSFGLS
jgi:hypothetical protein